MTGGKGLTIVFLCLALTGACGRGRPPEATAGRLDLSGHSLATPIPIGGEWGFYASELLAEFPTGSPTQVRRIGTIWNDTFLDGRGFATYRLKLLLPEGRFAVRIPEQGTAYALFCNGKAIVRSGRVGRTEGEWEARLSMQTASLCAGRELELALQVANFGHRNGGAWHPPVVGTPEGIEAERNRRWVLDLLLVGAHMMLALYHLVLFSLRPNDRSTLYFSLWCFSNGVRVASLGERLLNWILPSLPGWIGHRIEYLSLYFGVAMLIFYLREVFPDYMNHRVFRFFAITMGACIVWALAMPYAHFARSLDVFYLLGAASILYLLFLTVRVYLARHEDGPLFLAGVLILAVGSANDILHNVYVIDTGLYLQYTFFAFMVIQSVVLARRFSASFQHRAVLAERLQTLLSVTRLLGTTDDAGAAGRTALERIDALFGRRAHGELYLQATTGGAWTCQAVSDGTLGPPVTVEESGVPASVEGPVFRAGTKMVLPCRAGRETLAVLVVEHVPNAQWDREVEVIVGVLDALGLTLSALRKRQREKLEAVGQVAAEIVHDINNHCQLLLQTVRDPGGQARPVAETIEREAGLLRDLALDILDFSKDRILLRTVPVDLQEFGATVGAELRTVTGERNQSLLVDWKADGRTESLDPGRIRRLLMNLVGNASEAMTEGGRVRLSAEREDDLLYLVVEDDGPGIAPDMLERIFEPFVTNKPGGSGLGLAIVRRIVDGHRGHIEAFSGPGDGTRFTIVLPLG